MQGNIELGTLYAEIDRKIVQFAESSSLICPAGCGKCCDHADTEISPLEASLIATYIRNEAPEIEDVFLARMSREDDECEFYDRDAHLHCRIYPVRPLICRCYGYSAETDRIGSLLFSACRHMNLPAGLRAGGGVIRILAEPHPPVMASYRDAIGAGMRPLGDAVARGLNEKRE